LRRRRMTRREVLLAVLLLLVPVVQLAACAALRRAPAVGPGHCGVLWHVTAAPRCANCEMFLVGSVHAGRPSMYPLDPSIEAAFQRADGMAMEMDPSQDEIGEVQRMTAAATLPPGVALSFTVHPETYLRLEAALDHFQIPLQSVEHLRPWAVALKLNRLNLAAAGYSNDDGVDHYFLRQAAGAKRIVALETVDSKIRMLNALPPEAQERFLLDNLAEPEAFATHVQALTVAWCRGDTQALEKMTSRGPENLDGAALDAEILLARNATMTRRLEELLTAPGTWFVVVGTAHLLGQNSIVAALRRDGYTVVPPLLPQGAAAS